MSEIKNINGVFIHESSYIDENCTIGIDTKIWHFSHIMKNSKIGKNCTLGQNVMVASDVVIGDFVKIQNNVSIYSGVICEDCVFIGPSVVFTNILNPRSHVNRKNEFISTVIKKGASIGANSTIICGNTIGKYSLIGAGSVITKNVPDYALMLGNPAKIVGWVSEYGNKLDFSKNNLATCPQGKDSYVFINGKVVKI